jgi:hypothetical protein
VPDHHRHHHGHRRLARRCRHHLGARQPPWTSAITALACCRGQKHRPAQAHLGLSWPGARGRACRGTTVARGASQHLCRRIALTARSSVTSPPGHAPSELEPNATTALARRGPRHRCRHPGFARRDPWRWREGGNRGGQEEEACGRRHGHRGEGERGLLTGGLQVES